MSEDRLKTLLGELRAPDEAGAERRGLALVNAAFAGRQVQAHRSVLPRLAVAFAVITLLAALLLSPAGAAVRDWIDDAFTAGVRDAEPALTDVPGGGRLLVQSPSGPWVVRPDGARRLLGHYAGAAWSPRGLFVAAISGRTLSALEPDGTPRWSLSAPAPVSDPRWSPSGFRIAYRAGRALRALTADGSGDKLLDPRSAPVPAEWFPPGLHLLAYVSAAGQLRIVNADTAAVIGAARAAANVEALSWAPDGSALLQVTPRGLSLREVRTLKLSGAASLGPARRLPLPAGSQVSAAAFAPGSRTVAVLLRRKARAGTPRSEVVLVDPAGGPARLLFTLSGRLSNLVWSPDGRRLLLAWPEADQWLFLPLGGNRQIRAVDGIAAAFSPGAPQADRFPRIEGWCCAR